MGMPMSISVRGAETSGPSYEVVVKKAYDELRRVDRLFSTYQADSDVSRLNAGTLSLGDTHADVRTVAALCELARERTGGAFDARLPVSGGGTWFDPSGLVKTWAAERAFAVLTDGIAGAVYLGAAGDVIARAGAARPPWRVGIESPLFPDRLLDVVELTDGGVATSGTARRGKHLLDPRTGAAADALLSATVVGPSLLWADVYATAACVLGDDAIGWLASISGYEGMVVFSGTGHVQRTPGWPTAAR